MKVTIQDFNIDNFQAFLSNADVGDASHVLEISGGFMYTKACNSTKSFVKYSAVELSLLGDFSKLEPTSLYKFYLLDLAKINKAVKVYKVGPSDNGQTKIKLEMEITQSAEQDNEFYVQHIRIVSDHVNTRINQKEPQLASYLPHNIWEKFKDTSAHLIKFDIDDVVLGRIKKLFDFANMDKGGDMKDKYVVLSYNPEHSAFFISSKEKDSWSIKCDKNVMLPEGSQGMSMAYFRMTIGHVGLLTKNYYTCYLNRMGDKWYLLMNHNENNMVMAGMTEHDMKQAETE